MYGVRVSGVYSICTVDTLLHSEAVVSRYSEYFKIYEGNFENIPICDSGFPEFDELIMNMQKYILIHARQTRNTFDKSEYAKRHAQDEVLGSSFLRSINLKANEYLFKLEESGEIVFNTFYEQQAKTDGFFVTYSISADDIEPKYLTDIYLDALYELCNKGRFRKYNIQLITMTMGAMVLFIGESEYELITTALQKYFNRYALEYKLERFDLNVSHDRVYVNTQKGTKQRKIPSTYEQAMDLLVTTNDSVSVSESHIVKRAKVQRKKQERPYKPK